MSEGSEPGRVAVVMPDGAERTSVAAWLVEAGLDVVSGSAPSMLAGLGSFDAVLLNLGKLGADPRAVLELPDAVEESTLLAVVEPESFEPAVETIGDAAYDVIERPLGQARVVPAVRRAVERSKLLRSLAEARLGGPGSARLVGRSPVLTEVRRQIDRVRGSEVSVALFGESGTGKEAVARAIHEGSRRARGPFVAINCAALPEAIHEAELFGVEREAGQSAPGRFEEAQGGTLFLDEVAELSPLTQATLVRAIQDRAIRRVGGSGTIQVDARIISSSRRDLDAEVRAGRFREDLYFRLVVYPIHVPPLRRRSDDVPDLASHFLRRLTAELGRRVDRIAPATLQALVAHPWPGNVRELENVIHRALLACEGETLELAHLPPELSGLSGPRAEPEEPVLPLRELERRAIRRALQATDGSVEKAAKLLGMGRATLYRRLARDADIKDG